MKRKLKVSETLRVLQNIERVIADVIDLNEKLDTLDGPATWPDNSVEQRLCLMNRHVYKARKEFDKVRKILNAK